MAAAIAKQLLGERGDVQSAGVETGNGASATRGAIDVMAEWGLDIQGHASRDIDTIDAGAFDVVVAMEPRIRRKLESSGLQASHIETLDIEDPYNKPIDDYRIAANSIQLGLRRIFQERGWI